MSDVYIASERHRCDPPDRPLGSVWRCTCGTYLRAFDTDGGAPPTSVWSPLRWWNFRTRRMIRSLT